MGMCDEIKHVVELYGFIAHTQRNATRMTITNMREKSSGRK